MKANEIPEKIYSILTEGGFYLTAIKPEPPFADGIEYTRTDAFIKKAERYIRSVADGLDRDDDVEAFISEFRKYMKGE